jgi:hypothetical protein
MELLMSRLRKRLTEPTDRSVEANIGIIGAKRGGRDKNVAAADNDNHRRASIAASGHGKYMETGAVPAILGAMSSAG